MYLLRNHNYCSQMWPWAWELAMAHLCSRKEQHSPWTVCTVGRAAPAVASFCSGRRRQAPSLLSPLLAWLVLYENHEALAAWVLWVFYGFSLKGSAWISPLLTRKGMVSVHRWLLSLSFLLGIFIKYRSLRSVRKQSNHQPGNLSRDHNMTCIIAFAFPTFTKVSWKCYFN